MRSVPETRPPAAPASTGGYLVAFDGTWNGPAKDSVVHQFFRNHYAGTAKAFYPGVGATCGPVGKLLTGVFGFGARGIVAGALADLGSFYRDESRRDVPVDVLGYSRGAFQAVRLTQRLAAHGLPDRAGPGAARSFESFRPRVRFVGLISPVGQMGVVFTRLDPGWAKCLPAGVGYAFQVLASDPDHRLFLETKLDTSAAETSVCPPRYPHGHASIGWAGDVLAALIDHARRAGVPMSG